ncbi:MAG TPA: class I SAM-dependent methyltransferase [Methanomassiliicoccales archaeon]|jgi:2-polyprenyl-3-methyl-5-hydroxy-6-metoxy-1,4-benzoquinol methylase
MPEELSLGRRCQIWDGEYSTKGPLWKGAPRQSIDLPPGSVVLEVGCGSGKTVSGMSGVRVVGIDISSVALDMCRARYCSEGQEYALADAGNLPFRTGTFDVVTCFHVLEHLYRQEREGSARDIVRVLKPGGEVRFKAFSRSDMRYGRGKEVEPGSFIRGTGVLTHYFLEEEVRELFAGMTETSFEEIRIEKTIMGQDALRSRLSFVFKKPWE